MIAISIAVVMRISLRFLQLLGDLPGDRGEQEVRQDEHRRRQLRVGAARGLV
jgi:hypothetical protein